MIPLVALVKALAGDFIRQLRWRVPLLAVTMVISDLLEGIGLALLLPLFARFAGGQGGQSGMLSRWMADVLATLGLGQSLLSLVLAIIAAVLCQHTFYLLASWLLAYCKGQYMAMWRERLFSRVFAAQWHFFTARKSGQITNTILDGTRNVAQLVHEAGLIFDSSILVIMYLILAFAAAWPVALVIIGFGGLMFLVTSPILRRGLRTGIDFRKEGDLLSSVVTEFLAGAKLVKSTGSEARAEETFRQSIHKYARLLIWTTFHPNEIRSIYEVVAVSLLAVCLWVGVSVFKIDFASIILSVYLFLRVYQRLSQIQQCAQAFQTFRPAFDAVLSLDREAAREAEYEPSAKAGLSPSVGGADIRLRDVTVDYADKSALAGVTLALPAGVLAGIAGPSGAGKSTLVDCILGLVPCTKGAVEIGNAPLTDLSLRAWRRSVGYVAQETFLFNTSIRENIRWAHPEATDADVERAARQAHAADFIREQPQGYDTEVGERGVRLSGGQRQRIGLARALIANPRLLVLDEATSALDSESERTVLEAIDELRGQMTVIMVAHRLSTLRGADLLYLIEEGRIVESGTWDELIRSGTRFHDFWRLQSGDRHAPAVG